MNNSIKRLGVIRDFMETKEKINDKELKEIFLKEYPKGLTTHYFGIIKTVLMDTVHCTFEIRWLGEKNNDWEVYKIYEVQKDYTLKKSARRKNLISHFLKLLIFNR